MSPEIIGVIGLAVLIALLFAGMWIGAAMAMVGFLGYAYIMGINSAFAMVSQIPFTTMAWYPLTCVPLFIFMGVVIFHSGVGKDLYYTAYTWLGQLRGGLAMATVVACALFAAITGVSSPALATLGKVAVPEMRKYNYDDKLATGSLACAGTMAFLIPPSVAFIIYGILTENSIARLFMAGFLPGVLLTVLFMATIVIITIVRPGSGPAGPKTSFKEKIVSMKLTWPMVLLFLLVLGGIYGGIFTPTEAGAVGAFGTIIITLFARRLTGRALLNSVLETAQITAMFVLIIAGAFIFNNLMVISKLAFYLGNFIAGLDLPPYAILVAIIFAYVILGMFLDVMSCILVTVPIFFPIVLAMGFDPVWYGVIMVRVMEIGVITPPVGMEVFMLSGITGVPAGTIFRGIVPFVIADILHVALLVAFPILSLYIPSQML